MKIRHRFLACAFSIVTISGSALAAPIVLDFEGINSTYPTTNFASIEGFYDGGTSSAGTSGTNYGITFSSNALAICLNTTGVSCSNTSRGGQGDPNSQEGGLFFLSGSNTFMNDADGFTTGFSLFYTAINSPGSLEVYSGLDGTGTLLASLSLPTTQSNCPTTYGAGFCPFVPVGVSFAGTGQSISFAGVANQIVFDDVTFGSVTPGPQPSDTPEPSSLIMILTGAGAGIRQFQRYLASRA